jgi:pimeloyl-ACP methyl ester carboxylesterase
MKSGKPQSPTVIFAHGKESGPQGGKILAMAEVAQARGLLTRSIDYRGIDDPAARVEKCSQIIETLDVPPVLVGSSMGGYVSTAVAALHPVDCLFLLAPAFGIEGYPDITGPNCPMEIVHGWRDDIVPCDNSIAFAAASSAFLHLIDGDHRLTAEIETICQLFDLFLARHVAALS